MKMQENLSIDLFYIQALLTSSAEASQILVLLISPNQITVWISCSIVRLGRNVLKIILWKNSSQAIHRRLNILSLINLSWLNL